MPDAVAESLKPGESLIRRTETTTFERRGGLLPWLAGLVLIPGLLAVLVSFTPIGERDTVESDLARKAREALSGAGITGAEVRMDGVVAQVSGVPADQIGAARSVVENIDGVWSASVSGLVSQPADSDTVAAPSTVDRSVPVVASPLGFEIKDGTVVLTGAVPDDAAHAALIASATQAAGGLPLLDTLTVQSGVTLPASAADLGKAVAVIAASPDGRSLRWAGDTVIMSGSVVTEEEKTAAGQAIAAAAPGVKVDNLLTVSGPVPPPPPPPAATPVAVIDKSVVQKQINDIITAEAVSFQPNTAVLTAQGERAVRQIAAILVGNGVAIEIGGHIADVANSLDGQQISEDRATAVKARFDQLGVAADRTTAKGYGATKPIAPNDTPENAAKNRRVDITVI
jgi:outer membrane protein OmpA-like peptidoglycan-associated protein